MANKKAAFGKAFAEARKKGKSTFKFGGKSFNTKTMGDSAPRKAPVPAARPSTGGGQTAVPPRPAVDAARTARDVGDTRKRMELVTGSPSHRGTPIRQATPKSALGIDLNRRAADVSDTRKRMELVTGSPSHRGTPIRQATAKGGLPQTAVPPPSRPSSAVPTPASSKSVEIHRAINTNRANPRQADPAMVAKFQKKTVRPGPHGAMAGTRDTLSVTQSPNRGSKIRKTYYSKPKT